MHIYHDEKKPVCVHLKHYVNASSSSKLACNPSRSSNLHHSCIHAHVPYALSFQQLTPVILPIFPPLTTTLGPPILTMTPSLPHSKLALHSTSTSSLFISPSCRSVPDSTPMTSIACTCSGRALRSRDTSIGICMDHALLDVGVEVCGL